MKKVSIILLALCVSSTFAINPLTWFWNIKLTGDTATVVKWKANNDTVLNFSNRVADTLNNGVPRWKNLYHAHDSTFSYIKVDTLKGNPTYFKGRLVYDTIAGTTGSATNFTADSIYTRTIKSTSPITANLTGTSDSAKVAYKLNGGTVSATTGTFSSAVAADSIYCTKIVTAGNGVVAGNAIIQSWPFSSTAAMFGNKGLNNTVSGNYSLIQTATGGTYLNASYGQPILLNVNHSQQVRIDSALITISDSIYSTKGIKTLKSVTCDTLIFGSGEKFIVEKGSFTYGLSGMSSAYTSTAYYRRTGNLVSITFTPGATDPVSNYCSGTSNSTSMYITGIPTALQPIFSAAPPMNQKLSIGVVNDGGRLQGEIDIPQGPSATQWQVSRTIPGSSEMSYVFTASSYKGIAYCTVTYLLYP